MDARQLRLQMKRQKILNKRPELISADPHFFVCNKCHRLFIQEIKSSPASDPTCCGQKMEQLIPKDSGNGEEEHLPLLTFTGGISKSHAAKVEISSRPHPMDKTHRIEWVYLKTATGSQFKRLRVAQYPLVTFALADEDAYAYCNRDVCINCVFHCKRGFAAYAYCNRHGLWRVQI
ncbi:MULTISPECIES: desulfoferrodoxin family protein [unclassified Sporolactobacillus]|uniref:desulfoferrodoxin family protein n=1 Tax=unclassified Sporolactobacillus TaxID=2628533 RepID=UPI002368AFA4|nr:desulfoferrodoxin family protein [Sporolactobacillus sp. CQH2019]MDD9146946.1 desulfoferrodoxin family protein [Sporolactobacillus sp. CQH2019]